MRQGFSTVELLVVTVLLGILFTIGVFSGHAILRGQERASFLKTFQNVFWQGATEAASRGRELALVKNGSLLTLQDGPRVLRSWNIPEGASLGREGSPLPDGTLARFTPPGKLKDAQGGELLSPLVFEVVLGNKTYRYTVSLIGEAKVEGP
ncbi:type IV pilin [Thermus scotoductus]|uniref:Type IV pilin n=1 Tax=Thermus scotoductus TaxID=37636 RepID=A0A430USR8_THESC|nr:prepilin-type N-terminal cleavage/methylation domain-containing protein [Thermus scotoductus]RTG96194.1 type IV pilin [Thermus scotoductus]RTH05719.1 type IV pilin [Thermus scotoductus]RTH10513.1 type IV pilin [Thermus scotoductus]RTH11713.1 type IV pilin [Thermus scotoductus]RTH18435.1 type IV pilin [Thermus scotoductus]